MVPNQFPKITGQPYKIAFVGEAPGETEEHLGLPFVGKSGGLLWAVAAKHGIVRDACFVGNVCQIRPPQNKIENFKWDGVEIQSGLEQLWKDIDEYNPNLCVLLGNSPLKAFTGETGITNYRGSLLLGRQRKCLPTLHPAGVLREYSGKCLLDLDLRRASIEGRTPNLTLPERNLLPSLNFDEILARLHEISLHKPTIAIDIEGYWDSIWCISIATSPSDCFVIPLTGHEEHIEKHLLLELAKVLVDPSVPKILQNALYDTFCLQYGYRIPVRGVVDDTMLAHWELFCELPKSLSFQASIYTREPYWKDERDDESTQVKLLYCCKDSAVTYECRDVINRQLKGSEKAHYKFNLSLLEPLLYMEQKGINYDSTKAKEKLDWCNSQINRLQWALNRIAGCPDPQTVAGWVSVCRDNLCFKRSSAFINLVPDVVPHAKLTCLHLAQRATELLNKGNPLSQSASGELAAIVTEPQNVDKSYNLNVESSTQMPNFLYRQLGLPIQFKKEHGRLTTKETTDVLALLTLYKKTSDPTLKLILKIRSLRTRCESLAASTDPDGRIRCGYNAVGTETGRLSCYESPTGSGFNLQTATKKDRDLFLPDPGYWFFQCDLSGADGWTVAAHCRAVGDPTMLDDYRFGLKPARIIALLYERGREVLAYSRDRLKDEGKRVDPDGWLYFASKRVQHGSNYGMKEKTMSDQILKDSFKLFGEPIYVDPKTCAQLQLLYNLRYPGLAVWHRRIKSQLKTYGYLISASGHRRTFFDRRDDYDTFKAACADEPQNNTTYATKLATAKLWTDPDNRVRIEAEPRPDGTAPRLGCKPRIELRVQPLHTVHDSLLGQWRKEITEWACKKMHTWFDNKLTVAGQEIVIPFEGAYGKSWGDLREGVI